MLGSISGINGSGTDTNIGIGTTTPSERLTIKTPTGKYGFIHTDGLITVGSFVGGSGNGGYLGTKSNHPLHFFVNDGAPSMTVDTGGIVHLNTLGNAGGTALCRNALNQVSTCSSSLRYKTNVQPFFAGLNVINRLRPITFNWKEGGLRDIGLGAEDVAQVEPLCTFKNDKGEVEGVKYAQLSVLLINAAKEQQAQFLSQQLQLKQQAQLIVHQESQLRQLERQVAALRRMPLQRRRLRRSSH